MHVYKSLISAICVLACFISCGQQPTKQQSTTTRELLEQELINQENAKKGNKHPQIEIITDAAKVARLRAKVLALQAADLKAAAGGKKTLAERYKSGDKSVVPELITILKTGALQQKKELYNQLGKNYDDDKRYAISEKELVDELLKGIENPAMEEEAVQLAGINELPGYAEKMEARLLSGKSTDMGRIFFWLGIKGKQTAALDYVATLIKTNKIPAKEVDGIVSGLENYGEAGNDQVKQTVAELALIIYDHKLISDKRIEELRASSMTSDAAEELLNCLFKYGDKRVIPIAQDILKCKIRIEGPVLALIRLEGPAHLAKVYALLKDEDDFYKGLSIVEELPKNYVDDKLIRELLIQFSRQSSKPDYVADRIVKDLIDWNAQQYLTGIDKIVSDKETVAILNKAYGLQKVSLDNVLTDMIQTGLIAQKPEAALVARLKSEAANSPLTFAYGIMEAENAYLSFDTETDFLPVDFDKMLNKFAATSQNVLKDMLVGMEVKGTDDKMEYLVTVIYKDKAYIARPAYLGDWYDMPTVEALLKLLLEASGSAKRFVPVESGDQTAHYVFGVPATIAAFDKKYQ